MSSDRLGQRIERQKNSGEKKGPLALDGRQVGSGADGRGVEEGGCRGRRVGGGGKGGGKAEEDGGGQNGVRQHQGPRDFIVNVLI